MSRPTSFPRSLLALLVLIAWVVPSGCSNEPAPPPPLSPEEQAQAESQAKEVMRKEYGAGYAEYEKKKKDKAAKKQ